MSIGAAFVLVGVVPLNIRNITKIGSVRESDEYCTCDPLFTSKEEYAEFV